MENQDINLLKLLYWDLRGSRGRDLLICYLIRSLPGEFGVSLRERLYRKLAKSCGKNLRILPGTIIINPEKMVIGDNVGIGWHNFVQAGGGVTIGSDSVLGPYVKIWTQNHKYDSQIPVQKQGYDNKKVIIGSDVWIGAGAFIMPGANIGDKCIISACSVIGGKDYAPGMVLAGHPARKIKSR